jgi:hypothetical protein
VTAAGPEFAPEGGLDRFVRIPYTEPEDVLAHAIARLAAAWRDTLSDPATPRRVHCRAAQSVSCAMRR